MTELENKNGVFKSDLMRTFKQLKESRAESVSEDVEIIYKRQIEDLCHQIRNYDRDRENLILDLSPSSAFSGNVVPYTLVDNLCYVPDHVYYNDSVESNIKQLR